MPHWDKFWTRVDASAGPKACWPWLERRHRQGYGWAWHCDGEYLAHRVAAFSAGILPSLQHPAKVLHECDNPPCCNPAHLKLGTQAKNMADAKTRGRLRPRRGGDNGRARLTNDQVRSLRGELCPCYAALGRKYGVSKQAARNVILRRTYVDVE